MRVVIGVGASRGVPYGEVLGLVDTALAEAGLARQDVARLATLDGKTSEPGLLAAAEELGVALVGHPAEALAAVAVPSPSASALAAVGTPSVAEAAALLEAHGGPLLVPKRRSTAATVAIARLNPQGAPK
ncbi:hypothetical protein GCM10010193_60590 [Kitasatospora atroaurantiaca]|uniref:Cobalamin synthesis G-like protein n=1 Tax=Kitasatospora atroaurantiaca TaxID=285545 RepID=A0A561EWX8_9ACTN|nr:cobalamin synthesis G-like protein [Kitasatospora atroaurantiaca]